VKPAPARSSTPPVLEWFADLELEHEGRLTAHLRSDANGCEFAVADRRAFRAVRQLGLRNYFTNASLAGITRWGALLPAQISLRLSGVLIGHYAPAAPLNWWSRRMGLPFGCLTINLMAFARAFLIGGR
jgi:hypothetical protein